MPALGLGIAAVSQSWVIIREKTFSYNLNKITGSFYKKLHISCPTGLTLHIILFDGNM